MFENAWPLHAFDTTNVNTMTMHPVSQIFLWTLTCASAIVAIAIDAEAESPISPPAADSSGGSRWGSPRTLDDYFPFTPVDSLEEWALRAKALRQQVLLAAGLWPMPSKTPLNAVIHGPVERDDYVVEKVIFESIPGHFVTGNLYRPKELPKEGRKLPGMLCPHGHWPDGRFNDQGKEQARLDLSIGAERWENAARYPLQARCVQLARMGCVVFHYDMLGYADSIQLPVHQPKDPAAPPQPEIGSDQFFSADADARLQTFFGLQTWNSVRSLDFLLSLPYVDGSRIGVTGASGGGTQSIILSAIDDRVAAAFPCVMVSTSMQGGCPCENSHYLRIGAGNVDIAALTAPRPLGLTAANDWTKELRLKGYPDLRRLYTMFGHPERLTATFHTEFEHNYNHVSRCSMYGFINRHFRLGFKEPVLERDFVPLSNDEMTVWNTTHPKPSGNAIGMVHEKSVRDWMRADMDAKLSNVLSPDHVAMEELKNVVRTAWNLIIGRPLPQPGDVDFLPVETNDREAYVYEFGIVRHKPTGEEVPTILLHPKEWNGEVVLWTSPDGKSSLWDSEGTPIPPVQRLLAAKCAVMSADLFGQGEATSDGQPLSRNNMVVMYGGQEAWQHYSAYTYGYNPPLMIQRVRDLLSVVAAIRAKDQEFTRLSVVGLAGAGPWVAAARAVAGPAINRAAIDTGGFRFCEISEQQDANFVPGAVKYGDLPMLLTLSAPYSLQIVGENKDGTTQVEEVYRFGGVSGKLDLSTSTSDRFSESAVDWIINSFQ